MAAPSSRADRDDPRLSRSRHRVLAAAVALLRENGAAGLTVEGVAARSGVAKTTIYRQFEDRDAIHVAAVEAIAAPFETTLNGGDHGLIEDVEASLRSLAIKLTIGDFAALLATSIDAAERSAHMAQLGEAACGAKRGVLVRRLEAAIVRGELAASPDAELLASALLGPLFYRRLLSRQPITDAFVVTLVRTVLGPLLAGAAAGRTETSGSR